MRNQFFNGTKKIIATFLAIFSLSLFQGCMYYYKVQTVKKVTSKEVKDYYKLNKYLILHQGDSAWHLSFPCVSDSTISGNTSVLPGYYWKFKTTKTHGGNRYKNTRRHDESYVLGEVHLYLQDSLSPKINAGDSIKIPYSAINKAEVYQKAKGRTTASWVVPVITPIVIIGGLIIVAIVGDGLGGVGFSY